MPSPDKKRKKGKKQKHSSRSRTPSRSRSGSYSIDSRDEKHHSHHKHRRSKRQQSQQYSQSRDRSKSYDKGQRRYKKTPTQDDEVNKKSPPNFAMWPDAANPQQSTMFQGMQFPGFFQQKIPIQLPTIPSNYKPNKINKIIKTPKTQFKGRLYIPYIFDIAMVTLQDKQQQSEKLKNRYIQKEIPKEILYSLAKKTIQQMEKRAKEQKQDENVQRKISQLQEELTQQFKTNAFPNNINQTKSEQLSSYESLIQISETDSLNEVLSNKQTILEPEIYEMVQKNLRTIDKQQKIQTENTALLLNEAKELFRQIKI